MTDTPPLDSEAAAPQAAPLSARRASPWRWALLALPLVAALVILGLRYGRKDTVWRLYEVRGVAELSWGETRFAVADSNALREALRPGGSFAVGSGTELEIVHPGDVSLAFGAGAAGTISPPPRRLGERAMALTLERGEVLATTGVRFRGTRFAIAAPGAEVLVVGGTHAVEASPEGIGVAALAGKVTVQAPGAEPLTVPEGRRLVLPLDGRPAEERDLLPAERERMTRFLERHRDIQHE